jgi:hypothetical protein
VNSHCRREGVGLMAGTQGALREAWSRIQSSGLIDHIIAKAKMGDDSDDSKPTS